MKESTRICRFAVIGTLNALITAITIWVMMDELDINYMLSNVTAYILAQAGNEQPENIVVEVDLERSENVRRWWPFLRDRRIDAYEGLTKRFLD